MRNRSATSLFVLIAVLAAVLLFAQRGRLRDLASDLTKPSVPSALPYPAAIVSPTQPPSRPSTKPVSAPVSVNLDIPFVSQAPHQVWDADHEEFCEEATVLMVASYIRGDRSVTNPDVAEVALQKIKAYEMATFGYFKDTTAAETARIIREHFGIKKVEVVYNPTEKQIKSWVAAGRAVIVPAAGRKLGNPNFKAPGPLYHMLVVKGYTANGTFITNDPGTRKGADYLYSASVIMNAMHDWNNGDVDNGAKVVIVVG